MGSNIVWATYVVGNQTSVTQADSDYIKRAEELPEVSQAVASYAWTGSWRTVRVAIDPAGTIELKDDASIQVVSNSSTTVLVNGQAARESVLRNGNYVNTILTDGSIEQVPEPAPIMLVGLALLSLFGFGFVRSGYRPRPR